MATSNYVGRFAPSPTGPLHFGSAVAALASFLAARQVDGRWLVRIEDLDRVRSAPRHIDAILGALQRLGLAWDGEVCYQSDRQPAYERALGRLRTLGKVYPCTCSRKKVGNRPYPGYCRDGLAGIAAAYSIRVRVGRSMVRFDDKLHGLCQQDVASAVGDFVVKRADGPFAYHLAVVVDDAWQGVTDVVRGADLLDSTPRQVYLQQLLGLPTPTYLHIPLVLNAGGNKLGKQARAAALDECPPGRILHHALNFLGQRPPPALMNAPADEILNWAIKHWKLACVPRSDHAYPLAGIRA